MSAGHSASSKPSNPVGGLASRVSFGHPGAWRALVFGALGLAVLAVLGSTLYLTWQTDSLNLKSGQIATRTIKAPATDTFVSALRTADARQEAYDDSRNVILNPDPSVAPAQMSALQKALVQIDGVRSPAFGLATPAPQIDQIRSAVEGLSSDDATAIGALDSAAWTRVKNEAQRLLSVVMADQVRQEDVAAAKQGLLDRSILVSASERSLAVALATPFVRANVTVDAEQTKIARDAAAKAVQPVMVTVQQGQVIVRDGDQVSPYDVEKLEHFGLLNPSNNWPQFIGTLGLLALITLGMVGYLYKTAKGTGDLRQLLLIALIILVPVVTGRFLLQSDPLRLMFPAAAAAMLLSILLDFQLAVVLAGFLSLYLGIVSGNSFEVALLSLTASLAGAAIVYRAERIVSFFWAALAVAATSFLASVCFALINGHITLAQVGRLVGYGAVNGSVSASLTFLFFYMLGRVFGIITHLQLLELAHPNQPLLYRLAREAPGTYHHSIVVSNLAESAVEAVGGDPLFARVACLYHDIGKVLRPSFFVENQANRANVHDALDPRTSAHIIQEHVEDGVRLAKKARLPQPIVDVIQQHHGDTLIRYFYSQALKSGEGVDEAEFRYKGPRPQSKEAAIIMLADSVEAAVRAASTNGRLNDESNGDGHRTTNKLKEVVDNVIKDRLEEGQLDSCDLTLRQVEQVRATFLTILEGIYHPRIEYPELTPSRAPTAPTAPGAPSAREPVEAAH